MTHPHQHGQTNLTPPLLPFLLLPFLGFSASVVERPGLGMSIQLFLRDLGQE